MYPPRTSDAPPPHFYTKGGWEEEQAALSGVVAADVVDAAAAALSAPVVELGIVGTTVVNGAPNTEESQNPRISYEVIGFRIGII